jgi:hypothetical protein
MATKLTNLALAKLIDGIYGTTITQPKYIGWGTGTTGAAVTDTTLETPAAEARTSGSASKTQTTVTGDTLTVTGTVTVTGSGKTISEAGLFDASTSGTLYVHGVFTGIALGVSDSIAFTITIVAATS